MAEDLSGTILDDRYRLVRQLGVGGMGTVYEAAQVRLDKRVAVKVLKHSLVATGVHLERFLREAKAASKIDHPNIVDISDFGRLASGSAYYVMELLQGTDVADLLRQQGRLPWLRTAAIVTQVLSALEAAHAHGVIHRDIKPANVFLLADTTGDGEVVKVLDFGIARVAEESRLTRADEIVGTAAYMAPEQVEGIVSEQTDVYAVGVLMYKMLTGRVPFRGANGFETLRLHRSQPPPPMRKLVPDISPAVEALVMQALAKRPELRFSSTGQMEAAIEQLMPRPLEPPRTPVSVRDDDETLVSPSPRETTEVADPDEDLDEIASTAKKPALARSVPPPPVQDVPIAAGGTAQAPALARANEDVTPGHEPGSQTWPLVSTLETTATQRERAQSQRRRLLIGLSVGLATTALLAVAGVVAFAGRGDDEPADTPAPTSAEPGPDKPAPRMPPEPAVVPTPPVPRGSTGDVSSSTSSDDIQEVIATTGEVPTSGNTGGPDLGPDASESGSPSPQPSTKSRPPSTKKSPTTGSVKGKIRRRAKSKCKGLGAGAVTVGFTISSEGTTMMVVPKPPHGSDDLGRCVAKIVAGARFPKGELHAETITVRL